jgi:hypothetical protein
MGLSVKGWSRRRRDDLQRFAVHTGGAQPEIEGALALGQSLAGGGLERFDLAIVMSRAQVLDLARTAPRGPHDLHRGCPRSGLHRADVGHHSTLRARI